MKRYIVLSLCVCIVVGIAVLVFTASPFTTTDCVQSHMQYQVRTTCIYENKEDVCTTRVVPIYVCDRESSPTPHEGWLYHH